MQEHEQLPVPAPGPAPAKPVTVLAREELADAAAGISTARKLAALGVAAVSDAISIFAAFAPPVQWTVDAVTAIALFVLLGFRWPLLPVLVVEAVPGVAMFPTWLLAVAVLVGVTPTRRA
jgi:hypothetical protein